MSEPQLYLLHYVILALFVFPPAPAWYEQAPLWLIVLQLAAMLGILSWVGVALDRRKYYFSM